jgi:hypothetical protein
VSEKDVALGVLAAAFHDVVQEWQENQIDGKVMRQRFVVANEQASAHEAELFLSTLKNVVGERVFSDEDIATVVDAIGGTIPDFSVEHKTVIQPNITEKSLLLARVLALADLGAAGMDGASAFLQEGNSLFREENLDMVRSLEYPESVTDEEKARYQKRMIAWSNFQPAFAAGRKKLLDQELRGMPETAQASVKKLFGKFDEAILAATERAQARAKMSFEELAIDMGFLPQTAEDMSMEMDIHQGTIDDNKKISILRKTLGLDEVK